MILIVFLYFLSSYNYHSTTQRIISLSFSFTSPIPSSLIPIRLAKTSQLVSAKHIIKAGAHIDLMKPQVTSSLVRPADQVVGLQVQYKIFFK